jgi:hypothetical protein
MTLSFMTPTVGKFNCRKGTDLPFLEHFRGDPVMTSGKKGPMIEAGKARKTISRNTLFSRELTKVEEKEEKI